MRKLTTFTLALAISTVAFGQRLPLCGAYNQGTCSPVDHEFWVSGSLACDRGLKINTRNFWKASDDICSMDKRNRIDKRFDWAQWASEQQLLNIGRNEPINWVSHLTIHNAYNNFDDGYSTAPNQTYSITSLLNYGYRSIDLDIHWWDNELRVCHGDSSNDVGCISSDRLYAYAIREIADWIDANPGEVVFIELEDDAAGQDGAKTKPLTKYFGDKLWIPADSTRLLGTSSRYPTFDEMLKAGKQVIVLGDRDVVGGAIFRIDMNGYDSRHARNFQPGNCSSSGTSVRLSTTDLLYWPTLYEGRSEFEKDEDLTNILDDGQVIDAFSCSVTSVDLDFVHALSNAPLRYRESEDTRLESSIWSWARDDMGNGGNFALLDGGLRRWVSRKYDSGKYQFACAAPRTGDPKDWTDKRGDNWYVTTTADIWLAGDAACTLLGNSMNPPKSLVFAAPTNAYRNQRLLNVVGRNRSVWLKNTLRPIPSPALTPAIVDLIVGAHDPAGQASATVTIWGPLNASFTLTPATKNGDPWFNVSPLSGSLVNGRADITITLNSARTQAYDRNDYYGSIAVTLVEQNLTNTLPIFLHVKLPTTITMTKTSGGVSDAVLTAVLHSDLNQEVRPTGTVELRHIYPSLMNAQGFDVTTVASAVVNSFADGEDIVENQVKFSVSSNLGDGMNRLVAVYLGDSGYASSKSNEIVQYGLVYPSIRLTVSPPVAATPEQVVTLAVSVSDPVMGQTVTGRIYFYDLDGKYYGVSQIVNGAASVQVTNLALGIPVLYAFYEGNSLFAQANSNYINYRISSPVSITVTSNAPAAGLKVDGVPAAFGQTFRWAYGTQHTFVVPSTFADANAQYKFPVWDDFSAETRNFTVAGPATLKATYKLYYRVTVNVSGPGSVAMDPAGGFIFANTPVDLIATPSPNAAFVRYTGDFTGTSSHVRLTVDGPKTIGAEFRGSVNISIDPLYSALGMKVDGVAQSTAFVFHWFPGENHKIEILPAATSAGTRYTFQRWSNGFTGTTLNFTVPSGDTSLQPVSTREFNLAVQTAGQGTVLMSPRSADGFYAENAAVRLVALPAPGYVFAGFSKSISSTQNDQPITMSQPQTVLATFSPAPPVPQQGTAQFQVSIVSKSGNPDARLWTVQLKQSAGAAVPAAAITSFTLTPADLTSCTAPVKLLSPLPLTAAFTAAVGLDFSSCSAAARFSVQVTVQAGASTSTATINNQFR